jgi:hypothetical protein
MGAPSTQALILHRVLGPVEAENDYRCAGRGHASLPGAVPAGAEGGRSRCLLSPLRRLLLGVSPCTALPCSLLVDPPACPNIWRCDIRQHKILSTSCDKQATSCLLKQNYSRSMCEQSCVHGLTVRAEREGGGEVGSGPAFVPMRSALVRPSCP